MIGQQLAGRYLILKQLGAGGFSETYLARDKYLPHHPLCVVKRFHLSPQNPIAPETAQSMFETEARVLNHLGQHHPQIPRLSAYCHEADQIYMVQEYIDGQHLCERLTPDRRLSEGEAIALLLETLSILEDIHANGVIHRDIKPSHLIRRRSDRKIVLIDFGAACLMVENQVCQTPQDADTAFVVGTSGYMPEEQQQGCVQPSSDLYALGISVIQLLTGAPPQDLQLDVISGELNWKDYLTQPLHPQLVAVLDRMVRRRAGDRYTHAAEALGALQSHPALQALQKRTPQQRQRLQRFLKVAAVVALVSGVGTQVVDAHSLLPDLWAKPFASFADQADVQLALLHQWSMPSPVERLLITPDERVLVTADADQRLRLWSLPNGTLLRVLPHSDRFSSLASSRDSRLLAGSGRDRAVRLWEVGSGRLLRVLWGHQAEVRAIAISPDGNTLASADANGKVLIWDISTGILLQTLTPSGQSITAMTYGATPDQLIMANGDRQIQRWDLNTGQILHTFSGHTGAIITLDLIDDRTLVSLGQDQMLVWDLQRKELLQNFPDESVPVSSTADQQNLVTVDRSGQIRTWSRKAGKFVQQSKGRLNTEGSIALSPKNHYLVNWSEGRSLQIWRMQHE